MLRHDVAAAAEPARSRRLIHLFRPDARLHAALVETGCLCQASISQVHDVELNAVVL